MHRWHLQRLVRWLVPTLVFAVALCALIARQKAAGPGLSFERDDAYVNLSVARTAIEKHTYALAGDARMPAVKDTLWRLAVAAAASVSGSVVTGSYIIGAFSALLTLLLLLRLARFLFPFPPFIVYTAVLLLCAPTVLTAALDGTADVLATALVTAAVLLHIEGLYERRTPLPLGCALIVGLLMWIRLEFGLLWIVLSVHAFVLGCFRGTSENTPLLALTRSITGLLLLVLCVFPLIAWNLQVIRVPWPQVAGAPFTLDSWLSTTPGGALSAYGALASEGMRGAFGRLLATPFLAGPVERVLACFGMLFIVGLSVWRQEERPYSVILFLVLLLPPGLALVYPYLGWDSFGLVLGTLTPLMILSASFGFFRVPFLVENLYRKWKAGLPAATGFTAWWIGMGSILLVVCLVRTGLAASRRTHRMVAQAAAREGVATILKSATPEKLTGASDEPGWLAYEFGTPVVDLTGQCTPELLTCLDSRGRFDPAKVRDLLAERHPQFLVLWDPSRDVLTEGLPCEPLVERAGETEPARPHLYRLNWTGAF